MIVFRLDSRSGIPAYVQVVNQVRHALRLGLLDAGDQLPTVKEVVSQLAINPNTVLKAYRELEMEGLVEGRVGVGTFVVRRPPGPAPATVALLRRGLDKWLRTAVEAGLDAESIDAFFRDRLNSAHRGGSETGMVKAPLASRAPDAMGEGVA
jgi:GntR family transcriptional regulator